MARGLDCNQIRERAIQKGLLSQAEALQKSDAQIQELLFEPGFSTSVQVSELSGRGIGLEIVRSQLQAIQGSISVQSAPQKGTTFTMQIPLLLPVMAPLPTFSRIEQRELLLVENFREPPAATSLDEIFGNPSFNTSLAGYTEPISPIEVSYSETMPLANVLPRSLKTTQFLIWASEAWIFFLPYSNIEENLPYKLEQKIQSQNQWFLHWRNQMLRLYPLAEFFK